MSIEFSKAQLSAVSHVYGPMMVLAGPGSGKTAVITGRLENLIEKEHIPPENILVVTFSKKAAGEMEKRYLKKSRSRGKSPVFGTFHSVFYSIIRNSQPSSRVSVIPEQKKYDFIRTAVCSMSFDFDDSADFFASVISEISNVKGNVLDINGYTPSCLPAQMFRAIYGRYQAYLRSNSLLDFDDMLLGCFRLLSSRPEILAKWQDKFRLILIDEFQDINIIQYETIKLLAGERRNIFIVGDDDQSIYGFRGARPGLMKRFLKDFPDAQRVLLDINYRSCREIVCAAGKVIEQNQSRFAKNIRSLEGKGAGEKVHADAFSDAAAEADAITGKIRMLRRRGLALSDMALLYRNNADMEYIFRRLSDAGIEFTGKANPGGFYSHFICRDIAAYIRAAAAYPACSLSDVLLIMNRPVRYIARESLSFGEAPFASMKLHYCANRRMEPAVRKFEDDIRTLKTLTPYAAVKYIRKAVGYDSYIEEYAKSDGIGSEKYKEVLKRLEDEAKAFPSLITWLEYMQKKTEESRKTAASGSAGKGGSAADAVNIMTIHASKGLEWEAVFIPMCNDSVIPGKNASALSSLEEERRVLYVAMTRAKSFLYISWPEKISGRKAAPSRFIEALIK